MADPKTAIQTAKIHRINTTLMASIAGRIDRSSLNTGALVSANQAMELTTIRRIDPINVYVTRSSTSLLDFRQAVRDGDLTMAGGTAGVKLELDNGSIYGHVGTLEFAEANVDRGTGTYTLRAQFPNPDRLLLPGMYVRARSEEHTSELQSLMRNSYAVF